MKLIFPHESDEVKTIAETVWTDEVKTAWAEKMRLQEEESKNKTTSRECR